MIPKKADELKLKLVSGVMSVLKDIKKQTEAEDKINNKDYFEPADPGGLK